MKQIENRFKVSLDKLTLEEWLDIEEAVRDSENRLSDIVLFLTGEETVEALNLVIEECPFFSQQATYKTRDLSGFTIEGESFVYVRDISQMSVNQYVAYEQALTATATNSKYMPLLLVTLTKKKDEKKWSSDSVEMERRKQLFLKSSCLNAIDIVNFQMPQVNNGEKDFQFLAKESLGHRQRLQEKMSSIRTGNFLVRLWQRLVIGLKLWILLWKWN
jgi:hypothetical protein